MRFRSLMFLAALLLAPAVARTQTYTPKKVYVCKTRDVNLGFGFLTYSTQQYGASAGITVLIVRDTAGKMLSLVEPVPSGIRPGQVLFVTYRPTTSVNVLEIVGKDNRGNQPSTSWNQSIENIDGLITGLTVKNEEVSVAVRCPYL